MLRELQVSGYRSLRQVALELSPLTVVVGANGTGKTKCTRRCSSSPRQLKGRWPSPWRRREGFRRW